MEQKQPTLIAIMAHFTKEITYAIKNNNQRAATNLLNRSRRKLTVLILLHSRFTAETFIWLVHYKPAMMFNYALVQVKARMKTGTQWKEWLFHANKGYWVI